MIREADDLPDLEDFTNEMEKIRPKKNESQAYIGDYTEPISFISFLIIKMNQLHHHKSNHQQSKIKINLQASRKVSLTTTTNHPKGRRNWKH